MRYVALAGAALALTPHTALAEKPPKSTGFTCTGQAGAVKRFNIDLKRGRYDAGQGTKRIANVTDAKITLEGGNPDLLSTPMGPILHSLTLDRATLVLTDQTLVPDRDINRTTDYQCLVGPPIDFSAGRRF